MKIKFTIIATLLLQVAFGQLRHGTYRVSSDTFHILTGRNFSELIINKDNTFNYNYRTSVTCLVWYDLTGTWRTENNLLVLTDTIMSYNPIVDYVKNKDTHNNKISITVKTKDYKPIEGVGIKYHFQNSKDTLTGFTDSMGNLTINTKGKKAKTQVEIWVVHFNKKGQDWTSNNFCSLSSEIECVIDDNAVDEQMIRTTKYRIENSDLIYDSQTFSKENARPNSYIFSNFRFVKE